MSNAKKQTVSAGNSDKETPVTAPGTALRLAARISAAGLMSRRRAAEAVKSGLVTVNGAVVLEPGIMVNPSDRVEVGGASAPPETVKYYIALNKPRGYVSSNDDPHADKLAADLIELSREVRLSSAGRLDRDSDGLLIFSNDGAFIHRMTHPSFGVTKSYVVTTVGEIPDAALESFRRGVKDAGEVLRALEVRRLGPCRYAFTLGEGRKREIRRMVAVAGSRVSRLTRVRHGRVELGNLPEGKWRLLTPEEVAGAGSDEHGGA